MRKDKFSGWMEFDSVCEAIRELVVGTHDLFDVEDGEQGKIREVQPDIITGGCLPIMQAARSPIYIFKKR